MAFINFPAGRKTNTTRSVELNNEGPIPKEATLPKSACKVSKSAPRAAYKKYSDPMRKAAMEVGMKTMFETGGNDKEAIAAIASMSSIVIPRSTLRSRYKTAKEKLDAATDDPHEDAEKEDLQLFDRAAVTEENNNGKPGLTSQSTRDYLQSVARARDDNNKGMTRKEMICFIAEIESVPMKTAENHFDHLIRSKQLSELKRSGRVVSAQPTTTNRTAITTTKLLRTYNTLKMGELVFV